MSNEESTASKIVLVSLYGVGPVRIRWLLGGEGSAIEVLEHLRAGRLPPDLDRPPVGVVPELVQRWTADARKADTAKHLADLRHHGVEVVDPSHPSWPFADDPDPPILLFCQGDVGLLGTRPAVAIVGTRRCTAIGREVARRFGHGLAEAGVAVVSGLASGIDGAAHRATLASGGAAVGIVGSGLDVVYPRANADLWELVAADGLLVSEAMLGSRPERWRFPARNRLIAGSVDAVVVVESHAEGGSLLTVGEAADRGVTVMAVPGSVTSPASVGTNQLLLEGAAPACTVPDLLDTLGIAMTNTPSVPDAEASVIDRVVTENALEPLGRRLLTEVAAEATHVDRLTQMVREPIPVVLGQLRHLESLGLIRLDGSTAVFSTAVRSSAVPGPSNHKQ